MDEKQGPRVEVSLSRDLGLFDITMIGIGAMIGAGIFVLMGAAKEVAGPTAVVALILNACVTLITAMAYAELGSCFPEAGGGYLWAREGLPAPAGFLSGWMSWTAHMIACSLYAVGFGGFLSFLLTEHFHILDVDYYLLMKTLAILVVLFFTFINYWGVQTTGRTESLITISKIGVLLVFSILGITAHLLDPSLSEEFFDKFFSGSPGAVFLAMALTFVAFEGYEIIAQSGEEVKNPKKNIPRAIFISIAIPVILYVLVFLVAFPELSGKSETAMLTAGWNILGLPGLILMIVGGLLSTTSALNATIYSSSRVSFAMGRDKVIPSSMGKIDEKRRTPSNAVIISGGFIALMALMPSVEQIAAAADIMFLLLFVIANACVISLRKKRPDLDRGFRVPLVPFIPLLGIVLNMALAASIWFLFAEAGSFSHGRMAWYLAAAWIMGGLAIHYPTGGRRAITEIGVERRRELMELLASEKKAIDRKMYRIMVPLADLANERLVRFGALVAGARDGELSLLNVYEVPKGTPPKAVSFTMVHPRIRGLERLERMARKADLRVRSSVKISHSPYQTILTSIEEENVDLLVLGWRGRPVGGKKILGSNIDQLVQKSECDVVVFRTEGLPDKINKILVLSGPTWHASHAMRLAILIAQEHDAEITILVVVGPGEKEDLSKPRRLMRYCEQSGVSHNLKVVHARTVLSGVNSESAKYDLIVLGATTEWVLRKHAFGRVVDQIAKKVDKPVLMFRKVLEKTSHEREP